MKKRTIIIISVVVVLFLSLLLWAIIENEALECNIITIHNDSLPKSFDGFRIAHISDLHSAQIGENHDVLLSVIRDASPDIIAITGDLMDCRDTDPTIAISLCRQAVKIAPVFYITGNHEARLDPALYNRLLDGLRAEGVTLLLDNEEIMSRGEESISIVGHQWGDTVKIGEISSFEGYRILLSHQPEDIANYAAAGYDLALCGHAHGGQFRLPFVGGLFAPGQGFFPEYDAGLYHVGDTDMVVSRGIGNSTIPLRFNNPPEVVLIILQT